MRKIKPGDGPFVLGTTCPWCRRESTERWCWEGLEKHEADMLFAEAFSFLSPLEREVAIASVHPDCWVAMWSDDEDLVFMGEE